MLAGRNKYYFPVQFRGFAWFCERSFSLTMDRLLIWPIITGIKIKSVN